MTPEEYINIAKCLYCDRKFYNLIDNTLFCDCQYSSKIKIINGDGYFVYYLPLSTNDFICINTLTQEFTLKQIHPEIKIIIKFNHIPDFMALKKERLIDKLKMLVIFS